MDARVQNERVSQPFNCIDEHRYIGLLRWQHCCAHYTSVVHHWWWCRFNEREKQTPGHSIPVQQRKNVAISALFYDTASQRLDTHESPLNEISCTNIACALTLHRKYTDWCIYRNSYCELVSLHRSFLLLPRFIDQSEVFYCDRWLVFISIRWEYKKNISSRVMHGHKQATNLSILS